MILERETPFGLLRYEDWRAGEWLTKAGAPAKRPKREYSLGGVVLDSVSSIIGTLSKDALVDWAGKTSAIGARDATLRGDLDAHVTEDEILDRLKLLGLGHKAAQEDGAARGNAVHVAFEKLAETGTPPSLADHPAEWRPYLQGAARAWLQLDCEPVESESIVCHPGEGYAGRMDLVARTSRGLTLIDYKSARKGVVYDAAHWQTRLYERAWSACGGDPLDAIVIVAVGPDASVEVIDCACEWEHASALLSVFRGRKAINASMAVQRKAAREARKAAA